MALSLYFTPTRDFRLPAYVGLQILLAAFCFLLFQIDLPQPPDRYRLTSAETSDDGSGWTPVTLPHLHASHKGQPPPHLYRLTFDRPVSEAQTPWSIFVPRFTSGIEITVNGTVIHDTRGDPMSSRPERNMPAIARIPGPTLKDGPNEIVIQLFVWGPINAYLDPVYAGPDSDLRQAYNKRILLFLTIPLMLASWQAMLGVILGLIWANRRHEPAYGLLAAAMTLGAVQHFIPIPVFRSLQSFLAASVSLESALVLMFAVRFTQLKVSRLSWVVFLPGIAILLSGLLGPMATLQRTYLTLGPASVAICILLISLILGWSAVIRKEVSSICLGTAFTAVLVCTAHDMLMLANVLTGERIFIARLSYSVVLVTIGIGLTWRFVQALNETDNFANRLVKQVAEAEEKLRASFAREEEQARAEALADERTRLMRDLHDGLGGQLVSIVALAEQGRGGPAIGEAARAALKDLRLVIDAMEDIDGDLMLALGSWRERMSAQLRAHDIRLVWDVLTPGGLPVFPGLRPWHVIQIMRLLDEAVTNAIKHSGAGNLLVTIETIAQEDGTSGGRITIADDGTTGFDLAAASARSSSGRGLLNMKKRAERCGAQFSMTSGPEGTCVALRLPGQFAASS